MLVSSFNLSQSFNYTPYLIYKKRFKSEINSFCLWTLAADKAVQLNDNEKTDLIWLMCQLVTGELRVYNQRMKQMGLVDPWPTAS